MPADVLRLEALLVGAVLDSKEPAKLFQAAGLQPEDFSDAHLRTCWSIAIDLARRGARTNSVALFAAGRATKAFEDADLVLLQRLEANNAVNAQSFAQLAVEFRRIAHTRKLAAQLAQLSQELINGLSSTEALPRLEAIRESYTALHAEGRRGSDAVVAAFESFERRKTEKRPAKPTTGLPKLDELVSGLPPKLCVLVGEPAIGKSALIASMIGAQLDAGLKVLLFSLEDGDEWLVRRHLALALGLRFGDVFTKEFPDGAKAADAAQALMHRFETLWVVTKRQARSAADIVRITTQYVAQHQVDVAYVDNATALVNPLTSKFDEPRRAAGRSYADMAACADHYRLPIVVLAHTKRDYTERSRGNGPPALSDIAETADAERYVRLGVGLWRKKGALRATVLKNTEGPAGDTVELGMANDAAMVDASSGERVNLHAEARLERAERDERKIERAVSDSLRRAELRKRALEQLSPAMPPSTVEAPPPEPQLSLLDQPQEKPNG